MIKPIMGNSVVKKAVLGSMLAGALVAGNATTKQDNSAKNIQYTEISKEASAASKAMSVPNLMQPVQGNGVVHYRALDQKIRNLAENPEEAKLYNRFINDVYNSFGTYGAALYMQKTLDEQLLYDLTTKFKNELPQRYAKIANDVEKNKNLSASQIDILIGLGDESLLYSSRAEALAAKEAMENGATKFIEILMGPVSEDRIRVFGNMFNLEEAKNKPKPTFEELSRGIDKTIENIYANDNDAKNTYKQSVKAFESKLGANPSKEAKARLIAFKFYTLDTILMETATRNLKIGKNLHYYNMFQEGFVEKAKP